MRPAGVMCVGEDDAISFRPDCYDAPGCALEDYVPLVNEKMRKGQWDVFRDFLDAGEGEALHMAQARGVGVSTLLRSVGKCTRFQIRALRYRSTLLAVVEDGWRAVRLCADSGLDAGYFLADPVFEGVEHAAVLHRVARRLAWDSAVPWGREGVRRRLRAFFPGPLLAAVAPCLASGSDPALQLLLYDSLRPGPEMRMAYSRGAARLLHAFWVHRRCRFQEACEAAGMEAGAAVCAVFRAGHADALPDVLRLASRASLLGAFGDAWRRGDLQSATTLASAIGPPSDAAADAASASGTGLALALCGRVAALERLVVGLLLERAGLR